MEIIALLVAFLVPIGVAVWTVRSSAKDTAKQIESIKELSRLQMDASIKQVELEIEKNLFLAKQAQQEWEGIQDIKNRGLAHIGEWRNRVMKEFQENKPERDYHLYSQYVKELQAIKQGLMASKKKIN